MLKTYKISTYGCQMNENDSEKISGMLKEMGFLETEDEKNADIVILNTCSVRENADDKVFGHLGNYKNIKKNNPEMILCVCGCMMQQDSIVQQIKNKHRHVDIIFGTHNIHQFPEILSNYLEKREMIINIWEDGQGIVENIPMDRRYPFKAYVSIMHGCNNFCSYCIVPYTRGRERSRELTSIKDEIKMLADTGCKEITLLGQNVNSYGKTLKEPITFAKLLKELCKIDGIERIRFMTSHPKDLSNELIDTIKDENKICKHLHLPFQSGSSEILNVMNRKYTKEQYLNLVKRIKEQIPHIALSTDVIVGFPGEREENFQDTLDVVNICEFDSSFTFLYSPRTGTPAENMGNQIEEKVKHERLDRLLKLQHQMSKMNNIKYQGKIVEVLVEGPSKNNPDKLFGRTESNKTVNFIGNNEDIGNIVKIKVTEAKTFSLDGIKLID